VLEFPVPVVVLVLVVFEVVLVLVTFEVLLGGVKMPAISERKKEKMVSMVEALL
jgi:hypothetical protein